MFEDINIYVYGFLTSYVVVFSVFSDLWSEVIVRFVDIGEIVDHHFLFIIKITCLCLSDFFWLIYIQKCTNFPIFYWLKKQEVPGKKHRADTSRICMHMQGRI